MDKVIQYSHYGHKVYVKENLKGKHKEACLCWQCASFKPEDKENNCKIASMLYAIDCLLNLVTPVWECPQYKDK